jgi:hypothetical protein
MNASQMIGDLPTLILAASGDHDASANNYENDTNGRGHTIAVFSLNAHVQVTGTDAVVLGVRHGNEKGNNSQDQHDQTDAE